MVQARCGSIICNWHGADLALGMTLSPALLAQADKSSNETKRVIVRWWHSDIPGPSSDV
jgi:hypothetical protein